MADKSAAGSWDYGFGQKLWQTSPRCVMASVVIQMSMPNFATSTPIHVCLDSAEPVGRKTKVAADRLSDPVAVERAGQRIHNTIGDRAVVFVSNEVGRDIIEPCSNTGLQEFNPLG